MLLLLFFIVVVSCFINTRGGLDLLNFLLKSEIMCNDTSSLSRKRVVTLTTTTTTTTEREGTTLSRAWSLCDETHIHTQREREREKIKGRERLLFLSLVFRVEKRNLVIFCELLLVDRTGIFLKIDTQFSSSARWRGGRKWRQ